MCAYVFGKESFISNDELMFHSIVPARLNTRKSCFIMLYLLHIGNNIFFKWNRNEQNDAIHMTHLYVKQSLHSPSLFINGFKEA